jgi:uncharacterized membrane protein
MKTTTQVQVTHFHRQMPFYAGLLAAAVALLAGYYAGLENAIVLADVAFFGSYLVLTAMRLPRLGADYLRNHAASEDVSAVVIFAVTLVAIGISIASLFRLINAQEAPTTSALGLALASVCLGWLSVHTMASLHYAHLYWQPDKGPDSNSAPKVKRGLSFPGTDAPGAMDFLYFAFVIGMTAQTSDIAITSTSMRTVNLAHAIVSFFFNTVLVAVAVNVAVTFHAAIT